MLPPLFGSRFCRAIAAAVREELQLARLAEANGETERAFAHLENAHVLGQSATYWHVLVHIKMAGWAIRQGDRRELFAQIMRSAAALIVTPFGWLPEGNPGGGRVSAFATMPIPDRLQQKISAARAAPRTSK